MKLQNKKKYFPPRRFFNKFSIFSYSYHPFALHLATILGKISYFYLINNNPHPVRKFERQIDDEHDFHFINRLAARILGHVIQVFQNGPGRELSRYSIDFLRSNIHREIYQYLYLRSKVKYIQKTYGIRFLLVLEPKYQLFELMFSRKGLSRLIVVAAGLAACAAIWLRSFCYAVSSAPSTVHSIDTLISMHDSNQDFSNYELLFSKIDPFAVWLINKPGRKIPHTAAIRLLKSPMFCLSMPIGKTPLFTKQTLLSSYHVLRYPNSATVACTIYSLYGKLQSLMLRAGLEAFPDLKLIFGSFEAYGSGHLLFEETDRMGIRLINHNHSNLACWHPRWRYTVSHIDLLHSDYWKSCADNNNDNINIVVGGGLPMERIGRVRNTELDRLIGQRKVLTVIGEYFVDNKPGICGGTRVSQAVLRTANTIASQNSEWFLIIRPRLDNDQYMIFIEKFFADFDRSRFLVDSATTGRFSLSEVLSRADIAFTGFSHSVFDAMKINVPIVQFDFGDIGLCYPLYHWNLSMRVTPGNIKNFIDMFSNGQIDTWVLNHYPHQHDWRRFLGYSDSSPSDEIATILRALTDETVQKL